MDKSQIDHSDTALLNNSDTIDIRQEILKYFQRWPWYIISIFILLMCAFAYLRYTTPQYAASGTILIKDNQKSGISDELKAVSDLGIVGTGSMNNTDNEIEILKSRKIIGNVVDSLNLQMTFFIEGRVKQTELYNKDFDFKFLKRSEIFFEKDTSFFLILEDDNNIVLWDEHNKIKRSAKINETINASIGVFKIVPNSIYPIENRTVYVKVRSRDKVINSYRNKIKVSAVNKNSSVIKLMLNDAVNNKAEDILDELVYQYNSDAIKDKNEVSRKTKFFLDERLKIIAKDLSKIQDLSTNFKEKNKFTNLSREGELALESVLKKSENLSYLFITHDLLAVTYICDRVIFFKEGKIVEQVDDIHELKNVQNEYSKALLSVYL